MKIIYKFLVLFLVVASLMLAAGYYGYHTHKTSQQATPSVVMERIKDIHEMALVEAQLSEIYDYKDYWGIDASPFRKKALILVQGSVKAGFDLEKMSVTWDIESNKVVLDSIPTVEILSIDHNLQYYDIQEGTFNGFDASKLTELNAGAKEYLKNKAINGEILSRARQRKDIFFKELIAMLEQSGWTVEMNESRPLD